MVNETDEHSLKDKLILSGYKKSSERFDEFSQEQLVIYSRENIESYDIKDSNHEKLPF